MGAGTSHSILTYNSNGEGILTIVSDGFWGRHLWQGQGRVWVAASVGMTGWARKVDGGLDSGFRRNDGWRGCDGWGLTIADGEGGGLRVGSRGLAGCGVP